MSRVCSLHPVHRARTHVNPSIKIAHIHGQATQSMLHLCISMMRPCSLQCGRAKPAGWAGGGRGTFRRTGIIGAVCAAAGPGPPSC